MGIVDKVAHHKVKGNKNFLKFSFKPKNPKYIYAENVVRCPEVVGCKPMPNPSSRLEPKKMCEGLLTSAHQYQLVRVCFVLFFGVCFLSKKNSSLERDKYTSKCRL